VVLLDIGLPGLTGYEVARRLREEYGGEALTLTAVTGYGQEEDRRQSRAAGFDLHWVKPVDPEVVLALLAEVGARREVGRRPEAR
jgi:CheY-like chemotaxis protein